MITNSENGLIVWLKHCFNSIFYFYFPISFIKFILNYSWNKLITMLFSIVRKHSHVHYILYKFFFKKIKTQLDCYRKIFDCICWYYKKNYEFEWNNFELYLRFLRSIHVYVLQRIMMYELDGMPFKF